MRFKAILVANVALEPQRHLMPVCSSRETAFFAVSPTCRWEVFSPLPTPDSPLAFILIVSVRANSRGKQQDFSYR
jgi:hypothetical protein